MKPGILSIIIILISFTSEKAVAKDNSAKWSVKTNANGFIDLLDCSSIGIQNSTEDYFNSPREVSPFGAFGSFIISTSAVELMK